MPSVRSNRRLTPCIPRTSPPNAQAMFSTWMKFSLDAARLGYDAARLGYEVQTVMTLRMLKLARGGLAAEAEMQRMMTEKGVAFAEAATTLATGGSMNKVVRRVRSRVNQNKRRLSR
jgi:hypothetical protein